MADHAQVREVRIGENTYVLKPFRAFKAIIAGELISRVGDEIRELLSELARFDREYRQTNVVRISKAQALQRGWDLPADAFVTPDDGEPFVELPGMPSAEERLMFAFPRAFKLAREEVTKLLALIVITNDDLRNGDINGDVEERLEKLGQELIHGGEVGEIVELLAATVDHVREQLAQHGGAVGKLRDFLRRATNPTSPDAEEDEADDRKTTLEPMVVVSASPDSSTSSPPPTDGDETESSTELTGATSSP